MVKIVQYRLGHYAYNSSILILPLIVTTNNQ